MSDFTRPAQSDFIRECQRLHQCLLVALQSENTEEIDAANDAFAHFLRMAKAGRLQEYVALRAAEQEHSV
jgi:hypothetical protein